MRDHFTACFATAVTAVFIAITKINFESYLEVLHHEDFFLDQV